MISGYLVGDRELVATLQSMPQRVKAAVDARVKQWGFKLQATVQRDYLRGPRPGHLGVVTSRLIASIVGGPDSRSRFVATATDATYFVGTNVPYGAMWESGFDRKVGAGARGGPRTLTGKSLATYIAKHPPGVKAMAARPFLKPALADIRQGFVDDMASTLQGAMSAALKGR